MTAISSLSVGARLALAFGALIALLFTSTGLNWVQQRQAAATIENLVSHDIERLQMIDRWVALSRETTVRIMAVNKSTDAGVAQMFGPEIGPKVKEVGELFARIREGAKDEREVAWFATMTPKRERLLRSLKDMGEARKSGNVAAAASLFDSDFLPSQQDYNAHIADFAALQHKMLDEKVAAIEQTAHRRAIGMTAAVVALALVGAFLAVGVTRHIKRSLAEASAIARAVAEGKLGHRFDIRGSDEFSSLMHALSDMTRSLEKIVGQVRLGTDNIATASAEIAQGNNDLSQRTEQQASNVQQAASAMDQMSVSVRQNAENARQVNTLAQDASDIALRGGEAVARVVQTMEQISSASHRVQEIVSVIDGISFQTNILALNAAVEAARAGEQGRGFAVVAGEVRSLAHRSANAAKEIKALISDSTEKVRSGSEQVEGAGRTMNEIVTSVQRVGSLVAEISRATSEQDAGISNIGQSVNQIDQMTQQNAALVEQAAAAAESMRLQAKELETAVAAFTLSASRT